MTAVSALPGRIAFRFEYGGAIGWGHLVRCAALAAEMRARGWTCIGWTNADLEGVPEDLRAAFDRGAHSAAHPPGCDWLVVDHYGYSDGMLKELRRETPHARLLVIDDDATRLLRAADIAVNSRLGLSHAPYASARTLLGERYALLRPGLGRPAALPVAFAAEQRPVLVLPGGTDPRQVTAPVLEAVAEVDTQRIVPVVVRDRALPGSDVVRRALQSFVASHWIERLDAAALAGWARACHGAVSACGGALYELAFLGVPFVGIVVAENQRALASEVAARWQLPIVDAGNGELRGEIAAGVRRVLAASAAARGSFGGIDGLGARRVADAITGA